MIFFFFRAIRDLVLLWPLFPAFSVVVTPRLEPMMLRLLFFFLAESSGRRLLAFDLPVMNEFLVLVS